MSDSLPTRRDLIGITLRAAALPGAALFFAQWLDAARDHEHVHMVAPAQPRFLRDYEPRFFTSEDFEALQGFTEILIPSDDTPGAREARCAHFLDFILQASDELPDNQQRWRDAMAGLRRLGFHSAHVTRRQAILEEISAPERDPQLKHPAFETYLLIKQQNAFAFYTSRTGMIDNLDYRGNSYNATFPACTHPEHHEV